MGPAERFPLAFELRFATGEDSTGENLPSLSLLLAAAEGTEPLACAFVYPRSENVALCTAVIGALSRLVTDFPESVSQFVQRELRLGQRVAVRPGRYIYEYDGRPWDGYPELIKLKLLDNTSRTWDNPGPPRQDTYRAFPRSEIVRLHPTKRKLPRGDQSSPLGEWEDTALDSLLGIRSGGNTALFRNQVLLLSNRSDAERFAENVTLIRPGYGTGKLNNLITWGNITEEGLLESDDRFQEEEEPLVAITHSVERLAEACSRLPKCSKMVIVDGVSPLIRNLQAYDSIATKQRLIVIANHEDQEYLADIAKRDCHIWQLSHKELFGPADTQPYKDGEHTVFSTVKHAAENYRRVNITTVPVLDERLESIVAILNGADRIIGNETDEGVRDPLDMAFGAMFELSGWVAQPSIDGLSRFQTKLTYISRELNQRIQWIPKDVVTALNSALALMKDTSDDPLVGWYRLESLVVALNESVSRGEKPCIVAKNNFAAEALQRALPGDVAQIPVYPINLLPDNYSFSTIFVASWPKKDALSRLISRYVVSDIRLVACAFEEAWLAQLRNRIKYQRRLWLMDPDVQKSIIGVDRVNPDWAWISPTIEKAGIETDDQISTDLGEDISSMERTSRNQRRGTTTSDVSDSESRSARYVGFVGRSYAYLTPTHELPVVTEVVRNKEDGTARIYMRTIDQLKPGEYVLFRDQGEKDVISLFAEYEMDKALGTGRYKERRAIAESWKVVLGQLGSNPWQVYKRLRDTGLKKHYATVKSWLIDADKIGPGSPEDLELIAQASNDSDFQNGLADIWEAIRDIRGAHIAVGQKLSEFLLSELPKKLEAVRDQETYVDLTLVQAWIVEIEEIGEGELEKRPYNEVNRLLWQYVPTWSSSSQLAGRL